MTTYKLTAWVKDSPNVAPIAEVSTRSFSLAMALKRTMQKDGFKVDTITVESEVTS